MQKSHFQSPTSFSIRNQVIHEGNYVQIRSFARISSPELLSAEILRKMVPKIARAIFIPNESFMDFHASLRCATKLFLAPKIDGMGAREVHAGMPET